MGRPSTEQAVDLFDHHIMQGCCKNICLCAEEEEHQQEPTEANRVRANSHVPLPCALQAGRGERPPGLALDLDARLPPFRQ